MSTYYRTQIIFIPATKKYLQFIIRNHNFRELFSFFDDTFDNTKHITDPGFKRLPQPGNHIPNPLRSLTNLANRNRFHSLSFFF